MPQSLSLKDWIDLLEKNHDKVVTLWTMYLTFALAISAGVISLGDKISLTGKVIASISFMLFAVMHMSELIRRYKTMAIIADEIKSQCENNDSMLITTQKWLASIRVVPIKYVIIICLLSSCLVLGMVNYLPTSLKGG